MPSRDDAARRTPGATAANVRTGHSNSNVSGWPAHGFGDCLMGNVELLATLEGVAYLEATFSELPEPLAEAESYDVWALSKIRGNIETEIARRERLYAAGHAVANLNAARHDAWLDLARQVRERGNIFDILCRIGHAPAGPYGRRGEYRGSCPFCPDRGIDRFISWHSETEPDRFYCRRCGSKGDVISLVKETMPGCDSFYRAVAYLAGECGLPLPAEPKQPRRKAKTTRRKPEIRIVGGKVVVG